MVWTKLRSLKPDKTPGPDGIHPYLLHKLASSLCHTLSILFTKSLDEMNAHYTWKEGHITSLHKKGSKGESGNYRPVSLTLLLAKCMESFIREAVIKHMMANNLFSDDQHGFVPGGPCMTQLLTVLRDWTNGLALGQIINVLYTDFSKAFDSVPCMHLFNNLGIQGNILGWIVISLDNRELVWMDLF